MGMFHDGYPGHEGWLVGFVREDGRWRELTGADSDHARDVPVEAVAVECSCGWRSPRAFAPFATVWVPHIVLVRGQSDEHEFFQDAFAWPLWRGHLGSVAELRRGDRTPYSAVDLAAHLGAAGAPTPDGMALRWRAAARRDCAGVIDIDARGRWWLAVHVERDRVLDARMLDGETAADCARRCDHAIRQVLEGARADDPMGPVALPGDPSRKVEES